jgi:hypothetical protein
MAVSQSHTAKLSRLPAPVVVHLHNAGSEPGGADPFRDHNAPGNHLKDSGEGDSAQDHCSLVGGRKRKMDKHDIPLTVAALVAGAMALTLVDERFRRATVVTLKLVAKASVDELLEEFHHLFVFHLIGFVLHDLGCDVMNIKHR